MIITYFSLKSKESRSDHLTFAIINCIDNLDPKIIPVSVKTTKIQIKWLEYNPIYWHTRSFCKNWRIFCVSWSSIALPIKACLFLWIRNIATCAVSSFQLHNKRVNQFQYVSNFLLLHSGQLVYLVLSFSHTNLEWIFFFLWWGCGVVEETGKGH